MVEYLKLQGTMLAVDEDALAEALSTFPVLGVQVLPETAGRVRVEVWLRESEAATVDEIERLLDRFGSGRVTLSRQPDEDWSSAWRASLTAFEVGERWWVDPHPDRPMVAPAGRCRLAVEPRSAFGSGTHETTRLVLLEMEGLPCRGSRVLDIGTGSGILAVAAERVGAEMVVALDTDPIAAWEARSTALAQDRPCRLQIVAGAVECCHDARFDLVLCNLITVELVPILSDIRRLLARDGVAVLSGILQCERSAVECLLAGQGLRAIGGRRLGEWASLRAVRDEVGA